MSGKPLPTHDCLNNSYEPRGGSYSFYNRQSQKGSSGFCLETQDDSPLGSPDDPILLPGEGEVKKIICGRVVLYREQCPDCGEYNLSGNKTFKCTACDKGYREQEVKEIDFFAKNKKGRYIPPRLRKKLKKEQKNRCYWCGHEFGRWYRRHNKILQLSDQADHKIPWEYCRTHLEKNYCLACNICNYTKSDKIFETETDCQQFLIGKWNKRLEKSGIEWL